MECWSLYMNSCGGEAWRISFFQVRNEKNANPKGKKKKKKKSLIHRYFVLIVGLFDYQGVPILGYTAQNCHCSWSMFGFFTYFREENHYRDFKASGLLLDKNYKAKLSDFGLAMLGPSSEESPILTAVAGTYGYAAPEYITTGSYILGYRFI
ncbi:hypothetical protein EZV62_014487 [Acer yangbiense]|uniref:Protein kinase domain-containing protein n=1 Tax=Acer yangbiense TaxID=1000413 RepID=A0A5C7HSZ5_9ROSI|nr:hypothetical protein EZV62_014487 [Acer yangbiense]